MLKLNVNNLRDGISFSDNLLLENGQLLLTKGAALSKKDIVNWINKGITTVFTQGKVINKTFNKNKLSEKADSLLKNKTTDKTKERLDNINLKINSLENIEKIIDSISFVFNKLMKNPKDISSFKEKLISASETLVIELKKHPDHYIDIITFLTTDNHLVSHSVRVAIIGTFIGLKMGCTHKRLLVISIAGYLHDIGRLSYPIINEMESVKVSDEQIKIEFTHPVYGYKIAKKILKLQEEVCQAIINHHEQPDGKGFPRCISETELFITDKIIYLANVFANLIEKNGLEGYYIPLQQLEYLLANFHEKFDHNIAKKLITIKELSSYLLLQSPPTLKEPMTNT